MRNSLKFKCPVCGFAELEQSPYDELGCATFVICPSCGAEFGYSDATTSHEELRKRRIKRGLPWSSRIVKPPSGWAAQRQLRGLPRA